VSNESNIKKDGGPAFPLSVQEPPYYVTNGMTLRDYFAGQVLAGICCPEIFSVDGNEISAGDFAEVAYKFADAMIAERNKEECVPISVLDDLLNMADEKMKSIIERVMHKYPALTKEEILFKYTVTDLIKMLGKEKNQ